jgi:hypothetical protein
MENPEKLATEGTQDEEKQSKSNTICVGHHHTQTNIVGGFGPIKLFNHAILFTKVPAQSQGSERLCICVLGVSCLPSFFHLNILELFQQCCISLFLFLFKLTTTYGIVNQRIKNFFVIT